MSGNLTHHGRCARARTAFFVGMAVFGVFMIASTMVIAMPPPVFAPLPTMMAAPVPAAAQYWYRLLTVEGSSNKRTELFTVTGDEWAVSWNAQPDERGGGFFGIDVRDADGDLVCQIGDVIGGGRDLSYEHKPGTYYLDISASAPYRIIVSELR